MEREFYRKVEEYAERIDKLERNLKRQGIEPTRSRRYRLNRIVRFYRPKTIVVENLRGFVRPEAYSLRTLTF